MVALLLAAGLAVPAPTGERTPPPAATPDASRSGATPRDRPPAGAVEASLPRALRGDGRPSRPEGYRWEKTADSIALRRGDDMLWRFVHDEALGKPHFDRLAPGGGPSLAYVMPPDHVWHYGLWFSWKFLNGVNYWEEDPATHRAAGLTTVPRAEARPHDDLSAEISLDLAYHLADRPPGRAVLTERRGIAVSAPAAGGAITIDWTSTFTAGERDVTFDRTPLPGEEGGKPYGGYAGLSVRLRDLEERQAWTPDGRVEFNAQNRYRGRARAFDYSGRLDGKVLGVAVLDHPGNPRSPSPWYAIRSGAMTFFSPAVICYEPMTLRAGESLELRYRIIVHEGRRKAERLAADVRQYDKSAGSAEEAR